MSLRAADDFAAIRLHMRRLHGIVLVIDHEDNVRIFGVRAVVNKGYQAVGAASLPEALDVIRNDTIRLIVVAESMLDGNDDFVLSLRAQHPDVPVLIYYSAHEVLTQDRFKSYGNIHFLECPFSLRTLSNTVNQLIGTDSDRPKSQPQTMAVPPMYFDVHGWPCACLRKLPVAPCIWEDNEPCPHCRKPLVYPDYDAEHPLVYDVHEAVRIPDYPGSIRACEREHADRIRARDREKIRARDTRAQEIKQVKKAALASCSDTALTFIVIREDNALNRKLFRDLLEASGCEVFITWDDDKALDVARSHIPDLIQSDISGVKQLGFEFARMVRRDESLRDVPLLCVTAWKNEKLIPDAGFDAYLQKPVNVYPYLRLIADHLKKPGSFCFP